MSYDHYTVQILGHVEAGGDNKYGKTDTLFQMRFAFFKSELVSIIVKHLVTPTLERL